MEKQSNYIRSQGYKCAAIVEQLKQTSRKKAINDQYHNPLRSKVVDGNNNFMDTA